MRRLLVPNQLRSVWVGDRGQYSSSAANSPILPEHRQDPGITALLKDKVNQAMLLYEDFIGIKQVKEAQTRVLSVRISNFFTNPTSLT